MIFKYIGTNKIKKWLNKTHYIVDIKSFISMSISMGFFIFIFLYFFKPFGIFNSSVNNDLKFYLILMLITTLVSLISTIFISIIKPLVITNKIYIIYFFIVTSIIGLFNYIFIVKYFKINLSILNILKYTYLVGIMIYLYTVSIFLRKKEIKSKYISIKSKYEKKEFKFLINNIVYIKSDTGYCEIFFLDKNNRINKNLIKIPLKEMEYNLKKYNLFLRVHKSYLINKFQIEKINPIKKKSSLKLYEIEEEIPISRDFDISQLM